MKPPENPRPPEKHDLDRLAERFVQLFPALNEVSRRVALQAYGLLAKGTPVSKEALAEAAGVSLQALQEIMHGWPAVFYEDDAIIGFWGLTPRPFSKHRFRVEGRDLYTWCAWDTLFIPTLLGKTAQVESPDPATGAITRLTVTPEGIESQQPAGAVMSFLEPNEKMMGDIVTRFCQYVYFFSSVETAGAWIDANPGTSLMTLSDGFELGRKKNLARFGDALPQSGR